MELFRIISRHGTKIIALGAVIGILAQPLASVLRPYLGDFVFVMLTVSILRTDFCALAARVRRPLPALAASAWITLVLPLAILSAATLFGPPLSDPVVLAILYLFTAPPPIVSSAAFAFLMGLDGALVLAILLIATTLMPLTAPAVAAIFVPDTFPIEPLDLAFRLAGLVAASFATAVVLHRLLGGRRITAARPVFDTVGVTIAVLFAVGAMDEVGGWLVDDTLFTTLAAAGAFAFGLAQMALTYALFRPFVGTDAVAIAYSAASRNAGLIVAAVGATNVTGTIWLFFALSQLPIFSFPLLLTPIGRRLGGDGGDGGNGAARAAPAGGAAGSRRRAD